MWKRRRGSSAELTLLFLALARAAGYQAYPMAVASRGKEAFDQNVLSWSQMDGMVAIVAVKGREIFFDPGTPKCPFGHMAPWHANVTGVSTETKTVKIRSTPREPAKASRRDRTAEITLAADGGITGTVKIVWTLNAGLDLRQQAISGDRHAVETAIEKQLQDEVPPGTTVKLQSLVGLEDAEVPLTATFAVEGMPGQATRKRIVVPAQFFVSTAKPLLAGETRTQPIALPSAYIVRDQMTLHLPAGSRVESLPEARSTDVFQDTIYRSNAETTPEDAGVVVTQRAFVMNRIDYTTNEYAALHRYFGEVAGYDQEQIVLQTGNKTAAAAIPEAAKP